VRIIKKMSKNTKLLQVFDDLPDLLAMANEIEEKDGGYSYDIQDKLREQYRREGRPFKYSMLFRHLDTCQYCNYVNASIQHEFENPQIQDTSSPLHIMIVMDIQIHEMREHQEPMPPELRDFLIQIDKQSKT
jgi:transposase